MDITFAPRGGWSTIRSFYRLPGTHPLPESPGPGADFIDFGSESLRRHGALYREFAEIDPTEAGVRGFLEKYADLGTEPRAIFVPKAGGPLVVFPAADNAEADLDRAIREALVLGRCVRLWDMAQDKDQRGLERHIKPGNDPGRGPVLNYDSHPGLPRGHKAPRPDIRETSAIAGTDTDPELMAKAKAGDLRPAARAYLYGVIRQKLKGGLDGCVVEGPAGQMQLHVVPQTLLHAFWLQFADEVTGKFNPSRCLVCRRWFRPVKHSDKAYCSGKCRVRACRICQKAEPLLAEGMSLKRVAKEVKLDESVFRDLLAYRRKEKDSDGKKTKGPATR
jgi:hypothetical protein